LILDAAIFFSSPGLGDQVSLAYRTTWEMIVLSILIVYVLKRDSIENS
jgi:hypothetical protein